MATEMRIDGDEVVIKYNKRPIILFSAAVVTLIITIVGIIVYIKIDKSNSKLVLFFLLSLIIIMGLGMIIYTIILRKRASENIENGAERNWIRSDSTFETRLDFPKPSAPPMSSRSSWALHPRKWSVATALPAYHPPNQSQAIVE